MGVPATMRIYVLGRVRYIGFKYGIHKALLAARFLEAKIEEGRAEILSRGTWWERWEGSRDCEVEGIVEDRLFKGNDDENIHEEETEGRFCSVDGE